MDEKRTDDRGVAIEGLSIEGLTKAQEFREIIKVLKEEAPDTWQVLLLKVVVVQI